MNIILADGDIGPGDYAQLRSVNDSFEFPKGINNIGEYSEELVLSFFEDQVGANNVFKPKTTKIQGVGEYELSDGIVRYFDTLFILQTKSRSPDNDKLTGEGGLLKWVDRKTKAAVRQGKESIRKIRATADDCIELTNRNGEKENIDINKYNLAILLLIVAPGISKIAHDDNQSIRTNNKEQIDGAPLIRMFYNDLLYCSNFLREMQTHPNDSGYSLIMHFIRLLQYQTKHKIGTGVRDFINFFLVVSNDGNLSAYKELIEQLDIMFDKNKANKHLVKKISGFLDYLELEYKKRFNIFFAKLS